MTIAATTHEEYNAHIAEWQLVRNAVRGTVSHYLRNVGKSESTLIAQQERQDEYIAGAIYYNFVARTLRGMQGAVFRQDAEIELPTELEYLLTNADGNGLGIEQQAQQAISEDASIGRLGLFADMPADASKASLKDQKDGMINPNILLYTAENIINWRTKQVGAIKMLCMVVLREPFEYIDPSNKYSVIRSVQYRTLELDEDGLYIQTLEREYIGEKQTSIEMFEPKMNGKRITKIPFTFVGAEDNDYTVDQPPLKALSELNIAHYRNSADNEEQLHTCAQAMLIVAPGDITVDQWSEMNPNGIKFGSRRGVNVGTGGNAFLLQAQAGNALAEAIKTKEDQAVKIGAQLITPQVAQTATEARIQQGADTSVLSSITVNVTEAYNFMIQCCADFLGNTEEFKFKLNTDFFLNELTAQDIDALVRLWQAGGISKSVMDSKLVEGQVIASDVNLEEMNTTIESEMNSGGGVNFDNEA